MSTIIKFDLKELKNLATDKKSCVIEKKVTQNLALQPWCLGNLKESIRNILDYKIGKFDKDFNGILLSYKNLRILQNVGTIRNDNADIHFQVQADYFIFRPYVGATLQGVVNKKSLTHLGILVHRVFNVVIPRPTEEPGTKWIGESICEGQTVTFNIVVLDLYGALPYIRGELNESDLNFVPEGDEDNEEDKHQDPVNVTYVNFDKTKPHAQKQIGDGLPQPINKTKVRSMANSSTSKVRNKSPLSNGRTSIETVTESKSNSKIKSKRLSKLESQDTTLKQSKKHKRFQ